MTKLQVVDTTELTGLGRKVYGRNWLNSLIMRNLHEVLPTLNEFLDKKIVLSNGNKSKAFKSALKFYVCEYRELDGLTSRTNISFEGGTIWLSNDITVKIENCPTGGHSVIYVNQNIHIGNYDQETGKLIKVLTFTELVHNYKLNKTFNEVDIIAVRTEVMRLETEIRHLKHSISDFN